MPPAETVKTRTLPAGNRGFTLFELIVVLFILGLVSAVVIVSTGRLHERAVLQSETRTVRSMLAFARTAALMDRKEIAFRINSDARQCTLNDGGNTIRSHTFPAGFEISGDKEIFFSPKGNSSGGAIEIDDGKGRRFRIEVDPSLGTTRIQRL